MSFKDSVPTEEKQTNEQTTQLSLTLSLDINNVALSGVTKPVIELTSVNRPLTVQGSVNHTQSGSQQGGAIYAEISTGSLLLSQMNFEKCKTTATSSEGGVVSVNLKNAPSQPSGTEGFIFKLDNVNFYSWNGKAYTKGKDVYISSSVASQVDPNDLVFYSYDGDNSAILDKPGKDEDRDLTPISPAGQPPSSGPAGSGDNKLGGRAITGIAIGVIVFVALVVLIVLLIVCWKLGKCCFGGGDHSGKHREMKDDDDRTQLGMNEETSNPAYQK